MPRSSSYEKVRQIGTAMLIRAWFDWYAMHHYAISMRKLLANPIGPYVPLSNFERSSIYLLTIGVPHWVSLDHLIGSLNGHSSSSTSIKIKLT